MSQNAVQIPTASPLPGLTLVNDLNGALASMSSIMSGASAPTTSSTGLSSTAGLLWHDTANNLLKLRNQADNAWITLPFAINENPTNTAVTSLSGAGALLAANNLSELTSPATAHINLALGAIAVLSEGDSVYDVGAGHLCANADLHQSAVQNTSYSITVGDSGKIFYQTSGAGPVLTTAPASTVKNGFTFAVCPSTSGGGTQVVINGTDVGGGWTLNIPGAPTSLQVQPGAGRMIRFQYDTTLKVINVLADHGSATLLPLGIQPQGLIAGAQLTYVSGTSVSVAAGSAVDSTNAVPMVLSGTSTLNLASTGAQGMDSGGLPSAGTVHFFIIFGPTTGTSTIASTSLTPALPSGYVYYRRVGSLRTSGGSAIISFVQDGDTFYWQGRSQDVNVTNLGATATLYALEVPLGIKVRPILDIGALNAAGSATVLVTSPDEADQAPNAAINSGNGYNVAATAVGTIFPYMTSVMYTNTSGQIRARANGSGTSLTIYTRGWVDERGSK